MIIMNYFCRCYGLGRLPLLSKLFGKHAIRRSSFEKKSLRKLFRLSVVQSCFIDKSNESAGRCSWNTIGRSKLSKSFVPSFIFGSLSLVLVARKGTTRSRNYEKGLLLSLQLLSLDISRSRHTRSKCSNGKLAGNGQSIRAVGNFICIISDENVSFFL